MSNNLYQGTQKRPRSTSGGDSITKHLIEAVCCSVMKRSDYLLLLRPSGLIFSVNESEVEIEPVVGNVVSFSYSYLLPSGNPVEPKVYRIREDVEWSDVLEDYYSDNPSSINGE